MTINHRKPHEKNEARKAVESLPHVQFVGLDRWRATAIDAAQLGLCHAFRPFPKPISKEGREVVWDESAVHAWWNDNAATLGRHPVETPTSTMPWTSFRKVMLSEPRSVENDSNGEVAVVSDDMDLVQRFERQGDQVRLWFRNVGDAVYFKLKH